MRERQVMKAIAAAPFAIVLVASAVLANPAGQAPNEAVEAQVKEGRALFVTSCAPCHGADGMGTTGPQLVGRDLPVSLITQTILNGRTGTSMPAFKDDFDAKAQGEIIAYVLSLSSGGKLPTEPVVSQAGGGRAELSTKPIAIGADRGTPAKGAQLFFDPTDIQACRACHTYGKKGGPVGPDLATLKKTPLEIFKALRDPKASSPQFPAIAVTLKDGTETNGIKDSETGDAISLYDVSSVPPVKRTLLKADITATKPVTGPGLFDHTKLPYSKQDLLDVSAFLGKTSGAAEKK